MAEQTSAASGHGVGDRPGAGHYTCATCDIWEVELYADGDVLPPCGICGTGPHVTYRLT